jgi:hypothetical protein
LVDVHCVTVPEAKSPVIKIVGLIEFTDESVLINRIVSQNSFIENDTKIEVVEFRVSSRTTFCWYRDRRD